MICILHQQQSDLDKNQPERGNQPPDPIPHTSIPQPAVNHMYPPISTQMIRKDLLGHNEQIDKMACDIPTIQYEQAKGDETHPLSSLPTAKEDEINPLLPENIPNEPLKAAQATNQILVTSADVEPLVESNSQNAPIGTLHPQQKLEENLQENQFITIQNSTELQNDVTHPAQAGNGSLLDDIALTNPVFANRFQERIQNFEPGDCNHLLLKLSWNMFLLSQHVRPQVSKILEQFTYEEFAKIDMKEFIRLLENDQREHS